MKKLFLLVSILTAFVGTQATFAQGKYISRNAHVSFFSATPMEDIEAHNRKTASILDSKTGTLTFKMNIKAFEFNKALMQEHFNENYMESDKYPNGNFTGKVTNIGDVNFAQNGTYNVTVTGNLTIHGVTKAVSVPGTIVVKDGKVSSKAEFTVLLADYDISIPAAVKNQISKSIKISVDSTYDSKK